MAENIARYIRGLETELEYATVSGDDFQRKAVKAEIASAKKRLDKMEVETAVAEPEETPEADGDSLEKAIQPPAETPEGSAAEAVCPDCGKTFKNAGRLASHQRGKHGSG